MGRLALRCTNFFSLLVELDFFLCLSACLTYSQRTQWWNVSPMWKMLWGIQKSKQCSANYYYAALDVLWDIKNPIIRLHLQWSIINAEANLGSHKVFQQWRNSASRNVLEHRIRYVSYLKFSNFRTLLSFFFQFHSKLQPISANSRKLRVEQLAEPHGILFLLVICE